MHKNVLFCLESGSLPVPSCGWVTSRPSTRCPLPSTSAPRWSPLRGCWAGSGARAAAGQTNTAGQTTRAAGIRISWDASSGGKSWDENVNKDVRKCCQRFIPGGKVYDIKRPSIIQKMYLPNYNVIRRRLVCRYIMAEQKKAEEFGITEDDVSEIRQDINKFRQRTDNLVHKHWRIYRVFL